MSGISNIMYSTYLIFHPFNGFWELKHEKKGNIKTALIIVFILTLVNIFRAQLTSFSFNSNDPKEVNLFAVSMMVVVPFFLWCVSNYSITTLVDGKGKFSDIFIATAYSLTPLILINVPMIIISHIITLQEAQIYGLMNSISIIWTAILLIIAMMITHDFTLTKTAVSIIITIIGIIVIGVLILLFFSLFQQLYNFFYLIYRELSLR